jgi:hypothetical protein
MSKTSATIIMVAIILIVVLYLFMDKIQDILTTFGVV